MFSYTSGTTGTPKGVKLTHKMLASSGGATNLRTGKYGLGENDCYISYLPSAHSFEQVLFATACLTGCRIGFFGGDVLKLVSEDLPTLKPTVFPSVPRLYNKIYGVIKEKFAAATGCKGWLIKKAVATKLDGLKNRNTVVNGCYDSLVFGKVKTLVGGNVKMMLTGSAPISSDVLNFLKICFCCPIAQGYGLTETSAGSVIQFPEDHSSGTCGGPVANVKLRLKDLPEMNYLSSDNPPRGEVLMAGSSIMKGYYKNEEKTTEMMPDGIWLCTGDVGEIQANGALKIIDRAKNIFKLSQGEYIAPEKLENVFVQSSWILQAWVHGDSLHDFVCLFAVLDPAKLKQWKENPDLKDRALIAEVQKDIYALAAENKFNSLEKPKQFHLMSDPFTIENDLLTPTMKLKRNVAAIRFKAEIEAMYAAGAFK
jgi:long-chain acyl-CoA synthetase